MRCAAQPIVDGGGIGMLGRQPYRRTAPPRGRRQRCCRQVPSLVSRSPTTEDRRRGKLRTPPHHRRRDRVIVFCAVPYCALCLRVLVRPVDGAVLHPKFRMEGCADGRIPQLLAATTTPLFEPITRTGTASSTSAEWIDGGSVSRRRRAWKHRTHRGHARCLGGRRIGPVSPTGCFLCRDGVDLPPGADLTRAWSRPRPVQVRPRRCCWRLAASAHPLSRAALADVSVVPSSAGDALSRRCTRVRRAVLRCLGLGRLLFGARSCLSGPPWFRLRGIEIVASAPGRAWR